LLYFPPVVGTAGDHLWANSPNPALFNSDKFPTKIALR
jgi:hypothetical protein